MRILTAILMLICLSGPALAEETKTTPALDEYNNVKPGLLMQRDEDEDPLLATETNAPTSPDTPRAEATAMTFDEMKAAYAQGKYDNVAKQILPLAKNGHPQAQELAGIMFRNGQGFAKNIQKGLEWLNKAAELNQALAQHHLGIIYFTGDGVPADPVRALMWLHIAIVHYTRGPEKNRATLDRDNLTSQLTRRERDRAWELAREWLEKKGEAHLLEAQ